MSGRTQAWLHSSVLSGSRIQHHDGKSLCHEKLQNGLRYSIKHYELFLFFQSPDMSAWQNDYLQGTGCEMYTETLSPSFTTMTFASAAE